MANYVATTSERSSGATVAWPILNPAFRHAGNGASCRCRPRLAGTGVAESPTGRALEQWYRTECQAESGCQDDGLQVLRTRLAALWLDEEDPDDEVVRPTQVAFRKVWQIIEQLPYHLDERAPRGAVGVDPRGGVRVEWQAGGVHVRLVGAPTNEGPSYVYYEDDRTPGVTIEATAASLAGCLARLSSQMLQP